MDSRLAVYRTLVGARIRAQVQYRVSFTVAVAGSFLASALDVMGIAFIFDHIHALGGWTIGEVAFLYAMSSIAFGFADLAVGHLDNLGQMIRAGTFDLILVRPLGSLFQVVSSDFALRRLGKVAQGIIVLVYAVARVNIEWTPGRIVLTIIIMFSGAVIFASLWVAGSSIIFWTIDSAEMLNALTYGGSFMTQYPLTIYSEWLRRFLVFIVPMAFVNYLPVLFILGKHDPTGLPSFVRFLSPVVACVTVGIGDRMWRFAVRHYRSTGS